MDAAVDSYNVDLHFGVNFSVVFEGVEGFQDGVVVVGTCELEKTFGLHSCQKSRLK